MQRWAERSQYVALPSLYSVAFVSHRLVWRTLVAAVEDNLGYLPIQLVLRIKLNATRKPKADIPRDVSCVKSLHPDIWLWQTCSKAQRDS